MKKPVSYGLDEKTLSAISYLIHEMDISATAIIEEAIDRFLSQKHLLLKYAGILEEKESDNILESIKSNRVDKDIAA
ncbi:MAG: hypothetical protein GDA44_10820 [Prochloron sp. SP5CPC1]|nr:hypothetical protein [Candidatus Paraprochloron terpiosi SP5CPC1]